jgi:AraC-like DNA-binding protein
MKPLFHKVPAQIQKSFSIRQDVHPHFPTIWHYHPELELHHVIKGEGIRFIGDNISNFSSGDIILLGQNLPHTWRCREEYFKEHSNLTAEAIIIHFMPDCLGKDFLCLPETSRISQLFELAKKGIKIRGETRTSISKLMYSLLKADDLERITLLLSIFKILAETKEFKLIASAHAFYQTNEEHMDRTNKICTYALKNYNKKISLEEAAKISNLSVTSFCRYFKQMTKKTFYDFVIEIRISHACRLLVSDLLPIEVIGFECGFNNVANFYRHFKRVTGKTPMEYKKNHLLNRPVVTTN